MHGVGYKSGKMLRRRELGNPITSNTRKSVTSRMEGQRKEIVLLEPGVEFNRIQSHDGSISWLNGWSHGEYGTIEGQAT